MDAAEWDARYRDSADLVWGAEPNRFVVEELTGVRPGRALDLGAGEGRNAVWLASLGWRVTAVDFSEVGVERGRRLAAERGVEVEWVVADVRDWQPEPGAFDLVLLAYLHLPPADLATALGRAAEAVARGGRVLVIGHDRDNLDRGTGGPQDPEVLYTTDTILAAFPGFTVRRAGQVTRTVTTGDGGDAVAVDTLVTVIRP